MNKKKKVKLQQEGVPLKEETFLNLKFTIDHRYMDGAQAAKIAAEIENIINDPATILA
jgi:pyruvate/2-oxoglutarate dehydrogenase complex dihydrolipoamide acyltransferase (E2) component